MPDTYTLLDSGNETKLEQFGPYRMIRPAAPAIWKPALDASEWEKADAAFTREEKYRWVKKVRKDWLVTISGVCFKLSSTDFGHIGVFPEHQEIWDWAKEQIRTGDQVLNLFAYSGGATLACAQAGAKVCHVDASKGMVDWARENAALNNLQEHPIRWIADDVMKFVKREINRNRNYDGIILDPPTFGRGSQGQVFKIERDLPLLLELCRQLKPRFIALSCHTPQFTPKILSHLLGSYCKKGNIEEGEMLLKGDGVSLPNGTFARWTHG